MGKGNTDDKRTYTLIVTDKYYADLKQIIYYIAEKKKQPLNAINVSKGINSAMSKIVDNPLIYAQCENIPTKTKIYRETRYKSWLIIFKVKASQVTILAVLSDKQKTFVFQKHYEIKKTTTFYCCSFLFAFVCGHGKNFRNIVDDNIYCISSILAKITCY